MDLVPFVLGPPLLVALFLIPWPAGRPALLALGAVALLWIAAAMMVYPIAPSTGPDDWFRGIEVWPLWGSAMAAGLVGLAQFWRWRRLRAGKPPRYVLILLGLVGGALAAVVLAYMAAE